MAATATVTATSDRITASLTKKQPSVGEHMLQMMKTAAVYAIEFSVLGVLVFVPQFGAPRGIAAGLAAGFLCALFIAVFVAVSERQRSHFACKTSNLDGERLLKQGAANHLRGFIGVGGWLYLTDQRLLFRSHPNNELSIPLGEIITAGSCWTPLAVPNGLRLVTAQGEQRFVVTDRQSWIKEFNQARRLPA